MKYVLLFLIKLYQEFYPKKYRGKCLYKESCSNFVYRITNDKGLFAGIKALHFRFKNCKPNYFITTIDNKKVIITANNNVINHINCNPKII